MVVTLGARAPGAVHAPRDAAELATLLRACDDAGHAVVLFGGNTLQALGNVPARYDVAIDLRGLDRILVHEPRDLTIAVEGGVTLAALDAALAAHGQFVPLDAPQPALATVGGTLASGWLGPRRATYGRPRDFVIGTTVALADGTIAKAGGMTVKNVSGYDLSKLYVGSLGTLGAIVRANFKTLPLPEARRIAVATLPEGTRARAIANVSALDIERRRSWCAGSRATSTGETASMAGCSCSSRARPARSSAGRALCARRSEPRASPRRA